MSHQNKENIDQDYVDWQTSVRLKDYSQTSGQTAVPAIRAETLDDLFSSDGEDFILLVFQTFLDRPPSESELNHYTDLVYCGISKSSLAARVRYCPEAASRPQKLSLKKSYCFDKISNLPILGNFVETVAFLG